MRSHPKYTTHPADQDRDPAAAPEGKDALVILIPVGHLLPNANDEESIKTFSKGSSVPDLDSQDWPALVERARKQVVEIMEARLGITGLREKVIWEGVNTPITCMFLPSPCMAGLK